MDEFDIIMKDEGPWFHVWPNNDKARAFLRLLNDQKLCEIQPCLCQMVNDGSFDIPRRRGNKLAKLARIAGLSAAEF